MQIIELYIRDQRVDLFKDESVTITDTIKNVRDVKSVFTSFSQQFTLPANDVNNKIFQHYYNFDIINGFDARVRQSATIKLNTVDYKQGSLKLNSVDLKEGKAHAYKVVFFGSVVNLNELLGNDQLSDLLFIENKASGLTTGYGGSQCVDSSANFNATVSLGDRIENTDTGAFATVIGVFNTNTLQLDANIFLNPPENYQVYLSPIYNNTSVEEKLSINPNFAKNSLVVPLITHTKRTYYESNADTEDGNLWYGGSNLHGISYTDVKFALRIDEIIKAIENTYRTANNYPQDVVFAGDFFSQSNLPYYRLYMWLNRNQGAVETSTSQASFQFNVSNWDGGEQTPGGSFQDSGVFGDGVNAYISPQNGALTSLELVINPNPQNTFDFTIVIFQDGVQLYSQASTSPTATMTIDYTTMGNSLTTATGTYQVQIQADGAANFLGCFWNCSGNYQYDPQQGAPIQLNFFATIEAIPVVVPTEQIFSVNLQMPEMKVIDFLAELFKIFNLVSYINDNGQIQVETLDDGTADSYYNKPDINTYDITEFIDTSTSAVDVALPFRSIAFQYEDLKTFLALKHGQLFNQEWGSVNWNEDTANVRIDGQPYVVKTGFGHMKYERLFNITNSAPTSIQVGWSVNESQSAYKGKPVLFYPIRNGTSSISWINNNATSPIFNYNIPSNSVNTSTSGAGGSANINFGAMTNEYTGTVFVDTLFQKYYFNYITNVFRQNARIVKFTAYLPLRITLNYKLNDIIIVGQSQYRINSIKTNLLTNKTELELITLDV